MEIAVIIRIEENDIYYNATKLLDHIGSEKTINDWKDQHNFPDIMEDIIDVTSIDDFNLFIIIDDVNEDINGEFVHESVIQELVLCTSKAHHCVQLNALISQLNRMKFDSIESEDIEVPSR